MIKAVIFDMDGVIIDSEPLYLGWYRKFLEENNIFVEDREFNKIAGAYAKVEEELLAKWWNEAKADHKTGEEIFCLFDEFYEEYAIHDYELPFEIDEYTPIEEVNRLCEMVEDLPEDIQDELSELLGYYSSLEDLCEHADDIIHYPDCDDMTDVAYYFIDECQSLGEIPDRIRNYIDYEAYGRDLDLEGRFVVTNHGVFECPY